MEHPCDDKHCEVCFPSEPVLCGECRAPMVLRKSPKYPKPFWGCSQYPLCRGTHGAHADGRPLGIPANKETKEWRMRAHDVFDTLWKCGGINMTRKHAYRLLSKKLGVPEVHIAEEDIEGCKKVIAASNELLKELGVRVEGP